MLLCVALVLSRCGGSGLAYACPVFVEFLSDPKDVSDQEGEFVEIRLWSDGTERAHVMDSLYDSLYLQFEDKNPFAIPYPRSDRLLLLHDTLDCPETVSAQKTSPGDSLLLQCAALPVSLPNSRETYWRMWAGECRDSVYLPRPKPGKSLVRVKESDEWTVDEPSRVISKKQAEEEVKIDSSQKDSVVPFDISAFEISPLKISEIHHCPVEPEPEWVEVYNASGVSLPLSEFRFCEKGGSWGGKATKNSTKAHDSIAPYESIIFTRDTLLMREYLGFKDVRLVQLSMGYLNNTAGSLSICAGDEVVDSVSWDKNTVACPMGFSPFTGRAENTPGFQGQKRAPFLYKFSSRVYRKGGAPIRVYVESDNPVQLRLLDSAGREQWKRNIPKQSNAWWEIPLTVHSKIGVAYVALSAGNFEKLIGILLRP